ncbi:MAG: isochorismatase family protein [Natronomonas sp.]
MNGADDWTFDIDSTALVVVGAQRGFDDERYGERNNPDADRHIQELLDAFRTADGVVVHVRHDAEERRSPLYPGRRGNDFRETAEPARGESIVGTRRLNPFHRSTFEELLADAGIDRLLLVGYDTDRLLTATAVAAEDRGYAPTVVSDAAVTFQRERDGTRYAAEQVHRVTLASLSETTADVVEAATVLARLETLDY